MNLDNHRAKKSRWAVLMYHFDEMCQSVMEEGETICLEELQNRLKKKYGVKCRATTVAKMARKLEVDHGITPIRVYYELNTEYFQRVGKHRPGTPRAWKKYIRDNEEIDAKS